MFVRSKDDVRYVGDSCVALAAGAGSSIADAGGVDTGLLATTGGEVDVTEGAGDDTGLVLTEVDVTTGPV